MTDSTPAAEELPPLTADVLRALVGQHRRLLSFLEKRVESPEAAEEILQNAFVKCSERRDQILDGESAVAWFYRLLRNAVIDHYRSRDAEARALARHGVEAAMGEHAEPEVEATICACINELIPTLKSEYKELLIAVELDGKSVSDAAQELHITPNNASVRLHRARGQLKRRIETACNTCAEHGCLDCTCSRA
jgi:RNA polymerase sigma-70 factor (ECF subfamily)